MMALCSRREYCKSEIAAKITALSEEVDATAMIGRLCEERFIDENRYAAAFVRDKSRLAGWGEMKIRYALQRKGLDKETIAAAMEEIDQDGQMERLTKMMTAKVKALKDATPDEKRSKLMRFATSRGFTYAQADEAYRIISR